MNVDVIDTGLGGLGNLDRYLFADGRLGQARSACRRQRVRANSRGHSLGGLRPARRSGAGDVGERGRRRGRDGAGASRRRGGRTGLVSRCSGLRLPIAGAGSAVGLLGRLGGRRFLVCPAGGHKTGLGTCPHRNLTGAGTGLLAFGRRCRRQGRGGLRKESIPGFGDGHVDLDVLAGRQGFGQVVALTRRRGRFRGSVGAVGRGRRTGTGLAARARARRWGRGLPAPGVGTGRIRRAIPVLAGDDGGGRGIGCQGGRRRFGPAVGKQRVRNSGLFAGGFAIGEARGRHPVARLAVRAERRSGRFRYFGVPGPVRVSTLIVRLIAVVGGLHFRIAGIPPVVRSPRHMIRLGYRLRVPRRPVGQAHGRFQIRRVDARAIVQNVLE